MARPILLSRDQNATNFSTTNFTPMTVTSPMELDRKLRQKRSSKYMEAITKLDSGGHTPNTALIRALIDAIIEELPEITIEQLPLGIVAKCYLEPPHDVHCLDREGSIINHYKSFESMPSALEKARGLAIHGCYVFVEVYRDCLRAVKKDGTITVVKED